MPYWAPCCSRSGPRGRRRRSLRRVRRRSGNRSSPPPERSTSPACAATDAFVVAQSARGLSLLRPGEGLTPFADGPRGYVAPAGEPYVALAPGGRVRGARCSFRRGEVFALEPDADPGVIRIDRRGHAKRFAGLPVGKFPAGISFDQVGRFGGRLLVTVRLGATVDVLGVDCRGRVSKFVEGAPQVEGGIVVAPRSLGPSVAG